MRKSNRPHEKFGNFIHDLLYSSNALLEYQNPRISKCVNSSNNKQKYPWRETFIKIPLSNLTVGHFNVVAVYHLIRGGHLATYKGCGEG